MNCYINYISTSKNLQKAAKNITKGNDLWKDLFQEVFIIILDQPKEKMKKMYVAGEIDYYFIRTMINEYSNKNNKFNKKYRHINDEVKDVENLRIIEEEHDEEEISNKVYEIESKFKEAINYRNSLRPIERILHEMYYGKEKTSIRKIATKTGIPTMTICNQLKKANDKIKNHLICQNSL